MNSIMKKLGFLLLIADLIPYKKNQSYLTVYSCKFLKNAQKSTSKDLPSSFKATKIFSIFAFLVWILLLKRLSINLKQTFKTKMEKIYLILELIMKAFYAISLKNSKRKVSNISVLYPVVIKNFTK